MKTVYDVVDVKTKERLYKDVPSHALADKQAMRVNCLANDWGHFRVVARLVR